MKRFSSCPETLGSLFYPPQEKKNRKCDFVYETEFQAMLDGIEDDDCTEESSVKKRRLSFDQVKALEKIFEVENKLDPERKTKIAHELGLQPRQVAIWFQNRRARSKAKRLERDYDILKASYEDLKLNFEKLMTEKEGLAAELKEQKMKVKKEAAAETKSNSGKERTLLLEYSEKNACEESNVTHFPSNGKLLEMRGGQLGFRDDSNFSTSSSSSSALQYDQCSSSMKSSEWIMNCYDQLMGGGASPLFQVKVGPQQAFRMEEEQCWFGIDHDQEPPPPPTTSTSTSTNIFSLDTSTNIFSLDQAPSSMQWHY